jgi:hypothetical protein
MRGCKNVDNSQMRSEGSKGRHHPVSHHHSTIAQDYLQSRGGGPDVGAIAQVQSSTLLGPIDMCPHSERDCSTRASFGVWEKSEELSEIAIRGRFSNLASC